MSMSMSMSRKRQRETETETEIWDDFFDNVIDRMDEYEVSSSKPFLLSVEMLSNQRIRSTMMKELDFDGYSCAKTICWNGKKIVLTCTYTPTTDDKRQRLMDKPKQFPKNWFDNFGLKDPRLVGNVHTFLNQINTLYWEGADWSADDLPYKLVYQEKHHNLVLRVALSSKPLLNVFPIENSWLEYDRKKNRFFLVHIFFSL